MTEGRVLTSAVLTGANFKAAPVSVVNILTDTSSWLSFGSALVVGVVERAETFDSVLWSSGGGSRALVAVILCLC